MLKERHPEYKTDIAVEKFKEGKVSLGRAAEIAGMSRGSFKKLLDERGIAREIEARDDPDNRLKEIRLKEMEEKDKAIFRDKEKIFD